MLFAFAGLAFVYGNFCAFDYERAAKEEAIAKVAKPILDPAELYQASVPVASVTEPQTNVPANMLSFPVVTASRPLDMSKEFEFRDWKLLCSGKELGSMSFGAMRQINYGDFVCRIQGTI